MTTIKLKNVCLTYTDVPVLNDISFTVNAGECVGIIGESGSGKTSILLAIMGLLPDATLSGEIYFDNKRLQFAKDWETIRWKKIALVFQNSLDVFNPVLTIGEQITEALLKGQHHAALPLKERVQHYLRLVQLDLSVAQLYPHQLSGGMRQKVLIAMALACEPDCLLVDEPTMALDALAKREVLAVLKSLQQQGITMLVISHELHVIKALTTRSYVLYSGEIIEMAATDTLLHVPKHPYTYGLINAAPSLNPYRDLWGIHGEMTRTQTGCAFANRCFQKSDACLQHRPPLHNLSDDVTHAVRCLDGGIKPLLTAEHIQKTFHAAGTIVQACKGNSLTIHYGEVVGLIGQSGSGKSTFASVISGFSKADHGVIRFQETELLQYAASSKMEGIQHVFQDPFSSLNESLTVLDCISEPLVIMEKRKAKACLPAILEVLVKVQLPADETFLQKRLFECSGGMRQRIALARALVVKPKLLIADEITAMLDPSTSATILRVLKEQQMKTGFSMLFITHDLSLARKVADRLVIMKDGLFIEEGPTAKLFQTQSHHYTAHLIEASLS